MNIIESYIENGFALVPIPRGLKGPRMAGWNERENVVTNIKHSKQIRENVGLAHAYCTRPTAVLDIDDFRLASSWLKARGVNLEDLLNANNAVQISSGRENRAKLLFCLPSHCQHITTYQVTESGKMILEFRSASANGKTVQDLLPPSIHPDTGTAYKWAGKGSWEKLPTIPFDIFAIWKDSLSSVEKQENNSSTSEINLTPTHLTSVDFLSLKRALFHLNSDDRGLWIKAGMALKHLGDEGQKLWIDWSATSSKYKAKDAAKTWDSLKPTAIDYRFIFAEAQRFGRINPATRASLDLTHDHAAKMPPRGITASELSTKAFPPLIWVLPDLLPEGCYLLSARPKIGKSWLALQISLAVAHGSTTLGKQAAHGKAIYLALEDNERRLQDRLALLRPQGYATPNLILHTAWKKFDEGGIDDIEELIKQEKPKLIVIDTLAKVRPSSRNNHVYENDYKALAPLTTLANRHRCCIVVVTHNRKGKSETDALEQISGSLGLSGAVDGALVIDGVRTDKQYKLSLIGRDIPNDDELAIKRGANCEWEILGEAKQVFITTERKEIADLLARHPQGLKPKEIAEILGKNASAVRKLLLSMLNALQVVSNHGTYFIPCSNTGNSSNYL